MICICGHARMKHGPDGCCKRFDIDHIGYRHNCECRGFQLDNLKYLEMKATGEI
jgi:hypothetical protein